MRTSDAKQHVTLGLARGRLVVLLSLAAGFLLLFGAAAGAVTADAGGPYTIGEGASLALDGSGSVDAVTYAWDLDNDGAYDDASGVSPTVPWATLQGLGLNDDGNYTISLLATDLAASEDTSSSIVTITNVAPSIASAPPVTIDEGNSAAFSATGTDPSPVDALSYFWDVDNDGFYDDATGASPTVSWAGLEALGVNDDGTYTVGLRITDDDGGTVTGTTTLTERLLHFKAFPPVQQGYPDRCKHRRRYEPLSL